MTIAMTQANTLSFRDMERAKTILNSAAQKALGKILRDAKYAELNTLNYRKIENRLLDAFSSSIKLNCEKIITASKVTPKNLKLHEEINQFKKIKTLEQSLTEISQKISSAKEELKKLEKEISSLTPVLIEINRSIRLHKFVYPSPPHPEVKPTRHAESIPEISGIYFVWRNGCVAYVGQSINLKSRLKLGSHHAINDDDLLSWVEAEQDILNFAESYYIGILKPLRNFGGSKK